MKRTGNNTVAVVGWGRGMGHTGHMYLADAVITQAKEMKADPYFFVSKTVGKDDPIYPDEKVKIYQKVFPQYANIFEPQGNLNQALTDLAKMGYEGVVVVVGADQKNAFQYLENPNKEGVPVYQTMGFKKLRVISRQETRSKYAKEEGPRATPMREILANPNADEKAKFTVWRRDMPQALSDEEVLDLMHKAEQRMKAIPTKVKKLKEFITRIRPMLKEANTAQKLKVLRLIKESMVNEFAPGNGDDGLPYAEYVVYQCDPKDQFEFIGKPLYQTDSLGMAHKFAYEYYLRYRPKAFVVYQPHKEASRGNYGVKGESDEEVSEGTVDEHIVKVKGGYELKSKHGNKNLGKYPTRAGAEKREKQVQYFKHVGETKSKAIAQTTKDLTNPPKVMQHRSKRDREREQQLKGRDIAKRDDDDFFPHDTETQQLMSYVKQHYPNATTKQQAFIKFVQRALQHSKEEDETQDKEIDNLKKEVEVIKQTLPKVAESTDYLDEK